MLGRTYKVHKCRTSDGDSRLVGKFDLKVM